VYIDVVYFVVKFKIRIDPKFWNKCSSG